jgi:hypothetical protein
VGLLGQAIKNLSAVRLPFLQQSSYEQQGRFVNSGTLRLTWTGNVQHSYLQFADPFSDSAWVRISIQLYNKAWLAVFPRQLDSQSGTISKDTKVQDQGSIGIGNILFRSRGVIPGVKLNQGIAFRDLPVLCTPPDWTPSSDLDATFKAGVQSRPIDTGLTSRNYFQ